MSWGPAGVFLLAILDSAGIPIPSGVDALVVVLAAMSASDALWSPALAVVGSTIGCMILFYVGRQGGKIYLDKRTATGSAHRFRQWFQQYGLWTVFVPTFLPIPLPTKIFVLSAGALGVSPWRYLVVILSARSLRYFGLAYCGAVYGETVLLKLKAYGKPAGIVALLLLVLMGLIFYLRSKREPAAR
jgi:membrane protein DedA with SNARE-associated domain